MRAWAGSLDQEKFRLCGAERSALAPIFDRVKREYLEATGRRGGSADPAEGKALSGEECLHARCVVKRGLPLRATGLAIKRFEQGHLVDALALRGDEGRGTLRKARGRCERSLIPGSPNGATHPAMGILS